MAPHFTFASFIYTPPNLNVEQAKVVVVIHGCLQSAEAMALGTGWNQIAEANNLVVIYPQVPKDSNPLDCWGWYLPENQRHDSGQLKVVMDEIRSVIHSLKLKDPDVFLNGISSGATTAAGLMACFPNEFKAGAIHSGPAYGSAQNLKDGEKTLKEGPATSSTNPPCNPGDFNGSVLVIQGSADALVNPMHGIRIISDFVGNTKPVSTKELKENELLYTVSDYTSQKPGKGRLVMVHGLSHAWSGFVTNLRHKELLGPKGKFPTILPFFSELGPSATNLMWEFFTGKSRGPGDTKSKKKTTHSKNENL